MDVPERDAGLSNQQLSNTKLIGRLLRMSWQYRAVCLQVLGYQMVLLVLGVSGLTLSGLTVDVLRKTLQPGAPAVRWPWHLSPPASWSPFVILCVLGGAVLAMAAVRAVLNYSYAIAAGRLIHVQIVPNLRAAIFDKMQRLSFRFFDAHASGTIITRVTRDVQLLRSFVDGVLIQGAIMIVSLGLYFVYMLLKHPGLTAASLSLTPVLWGLTTWYSRWAQPAYARNAQLFDEMILTMAEGADGAQVVKVFGREKEEHQKFVDKNQAVRDQQRRIFLRSSLYSPAVHLISQSSVAVLLLYGGWLVIHGQLSLGDLIVFAGLLQQFGEQVRTMATVVNTLQQSLSGARRVFEVLDTPVEIESPVNATRPQRIQGNVRFEDVHFGFRQGAQALRGIDLDVQPGQCLAILGETGAGKSTLISLIPRFYDPSRGRISIDGVDLRRLDLEMLRRNIGVVFQQSLLFSISVADNIAFGHPEASREQIIEAAKIARAHEFITALPKGYDTILEESATNLSGGQRQRIAIARAIMLKPAILLLDDPTTAVDPDTEHEVWQAIESATSGRTTFVVANRLSTLKRADFIVVLDEGRIVEQGTHAELMRQSGLYRRTADLQAVDSVSQRLLSGGAFSGGA
ncbi:MAG TPA: ABC transporter ATP-binding protein [Polyangiaceae bacterium]